MTAKPSDRAGHRTRRPSSQPQPQGHTQRNNKQGKNTARGRNGEGSVPGKEGHAERKERQQHNPPTQPPGRERQQHNTQDDKQGGQSRSSSWQVGRREKRRLYCTIWLPGSQVCQLGACLPTCQGDGTFARALVEPTPLPARRHTAGEMRWQPHGT